MDADPLVDQPGPRDVLRERSEVGDHLIGEDDRNRDRDQRLPKLLTLVPAEKHLLHAETGDADARRCDERRHEPLPPADLRAEEPERRITADEVPLELERDVAAEQEERAVGHVDDAHEAEDQREAARDDEVETGRGDGVQERDQEVVRVMNCRPEGGLQSGAACTARAGRK